MPESATTQSTHNNRALHSTQIGRCAVLFLFAGAMDPERQEMLFSRISQNIHIVVMKSANIGKLVPEIAFIIIRF